MKVFLETMGCQMNQLDSELLVARLRAAGHELVDAPLSAEVVLYNTCSVRQHPEDKVYSRLGDQSKRKLRRQKQLIIGVLGCLAQRRGEQMMNDFPQLDIVCGPSEIDRLPEMIDQAAQARERTLAIAPPRKRRTRAQDEQSNQRLEAFDLARPAPGGVAQSFVRVQRGCDKFCAYCVVPHVRGSEQSRDPRKIIEEVRRLAGAGCKEVTLLGQSVNSYHFTRDGQTTRLADLLEALDPISGIERIRFVANYPADFDHAILHAMRDLPRVCEYLHMPAQSGSDAVLRAMNRKYTASQYLELIAAAREIVPGITFASDFIVGFPGETEEDLQASCELVRQVRYKNSYIFKYSPRGGTFAADHLADDVPEDVKRRRHSELLTTQDAVSLAHHTAMIGTIQQVLVEGPSPRTTKQPIPPRPGMVQMEGRTRGDHIIAFDAPAARVGQLADIRITIVTPLAMRGELL